MAAAVATGAAALILAVWTGWPAGLDGRRAVATDWIAFYAASRDALAGTLDRIYDGFGFTASLGQVATGALRPNLAPFLPWLYPPHALLFVLPFGLLGFVGSYVAAGLVSLTAVVAATRGAIGRGWAAAMMLLCPATVLTLRVGQTSLLVAALLLGGLVLIGRRPVAAGILFGCLTFKPQFWLLVPVVLLAGRQWRALVSMAATALLLLLVSRALFGTGPWRDWITLMAAPSAAFQDAFLHNNRLFGTSIFTCAVLLGAPTAIANLIQALASIGAAFLVWRLFRHPGPARVQQAGVLIAAVLAAPNVSSYDTVLLGVAALLLGIDGSGHRAHRLDQILLGVLWLAGLFDGPLIDPISYAVPIAAFVLLVRLALDNPPGDRLQPVVPA